MSLFNLFTHHDKPAMKNRPRVPNDHLSGVEFFAQLSYVGDLFCQVGERFLFAG